MKKINLQSDITAEDYRELQRLYYQQMEIVVDLKEENILLHGLVKELRSKRKMKLATCG